MSKVLMYPISPSSAVSVSRTPPGIYNSVLNQKAGFLAFALHLSACYL